ncbi:MAG: maltotransferase domain-containing protein [Vicinamibacteraceae bacterium]
MERHIVIDTVSPRVDCGRYPVKWIVADPCAVEATLFRDGHELIQAVTAWRRKSDKRTTEVAMSLVNPGLDRWRAELRFPEPGRYVYTIRAWTDQYGSWLADLRKRVEGGQRDVRSEVLEGLEHLGRLRTRARAADRRRLDEVVEALPSTADARAALDLASSVAALAARLDTRADLVAFKPEIEIAVERERARSGAWYELFVRSQGTEHGVPGTFADAERRLPDIRKMGFDVVYLAPIHPIGHTHRKGRNNQLVAAPDDPGSPWAIGSDAGGHDGVEPALGTLEDFDRFVQAAHALDMELALDFAIQVSPDHPWVREHPQWFYHRPDGSIKYAENPPKKYEDIYPLNFDADDRAALWGEIRRVLLFWIDHGVKIFRVDNPHTKPLAFWQWLIDEIHSRHPDVIFLAEAFTRPPMMTTLAKTGFSQSYTYFTWRNTKAELTEYVTELSRPEMLTALRPNFFTNTPDILPRILADGGPPAFRMRLVLAATLSPSYGIYSGFELCERSWMPHHAIPGDIEYADSEKYEIKVRDWDAPGHIKEIIARVNRIRRENPALQRLETPRFLDTDSEHILAYAKASVDRTNVLLMCVNLDPHAAHECQVRVPAEVARVRSDESYLVRDLLTDAVYTWSDRNYVRLDPTQAPAHILRVERG